MLDPDELDAAFTHVGVPSRFTQGEFGILYHSVRYEGGQCITILRPKALVPPASQQAHFQYVWDGSKITEVLKIEHFA